MLSLAVLFCCTEDACPEHGLLAEALEKRRYLVKKLFFSF